ncbi:hypothetical protein B0H21DRAFT_704191, partial [Amylocystis lapponica]
RSVHNVRIEHLWVDVTAQVGATWAEHFTILELHHGLDINNVHHIWLLLHLFLPLINQQLVFFAESWNQHRIQIRNGPNRSPADMFGFDMFVHGVRGDQLPLPDNMPQEELEVFGVDWEGLRDNDLLRSQRSNNAADEDFSSWIGHVGPPENLNEVSLESPGGVFGPEELEILDSSLFPWMEHVASEADVVALWTNGGIVARSIYPLF